MELYVNRVAWQRRGRKEFDDELWSDVLQNDLISSSKIASVKVAPFLTSVCDIPAAQAEQPAENTRPSFFMGAIVPVFTPTTA